MALAQTAQLAVDLSLQGNFAGGMASAESSLGRFNSAAQTSGTHANTVAAGFGKIGSAAGKVGGALSHAGGQIKSLLTSNLGLLGLGAGLFSLAGALENSVGKIQDFSLALEKVQTLTGETAKDSGTLILLFEKFGLSLDQIGMFAGFAEKTLGKLNETSAKTAKAAKDATLASLEQQKAEIQLHNGKTKTIDILIKERKAYLELHPAITAATGGLTKLQALDKQYGLSLVDSRGHVVSYSQELVQLADFYDRNHDAATRAYVASTLLGRGYAALAPILAQGSDAIRVAAAEADALGLGSQATADKLVAFRNQMRDLGTQVNVLELQIGMALIPTVSEFASRISTFITTHGKEITKFFADAGQLAIKFADGIGTGFSIISGIWNSIPAPLRDIIVGGFATDKTVKWIFGFDPAGAAIGAIKKAIAEAMAGGIAKGAVAAGIGKLFVQPVWVTNPGFGAGGGVPSLAGDAGAVAEGAGVSAGALAAGVLAIPVAIGIAAGIKYITGTTDAQQQYQQTHGQFGPRSMSTAAVIANSAGITSGFAGANAREDRSTFELVAAAIRQGDARLSASLAYLAASDHLKKVLADIAEGLKHTSKVHHWTSLDFTELHAALRIANSSESADKKLADLKKVHDALVANGHHSAYLVDRITNAIRAKKDTFINNTYLTVKLAGQTVYRVSATQRLVGSDMSNTRLGTGGVNL